MSAQTYTEWECDRCGNSVRFEQTKSTPRQPSGWATVRITTPPKGDPLDSDTTRGNALLCDNCTRRLRKDLQRLPTDGLHDVERAS